MSGMCWLWNTKRAVPLTTDMLSGNVRESEHGRCPETQFPTFNHVEVSGNSLDHHGEFQLVVLVRHGARPFELHIFKDDPSVGAHSAVDVAQSLPDQLQVPSGRKQVPA